MRSSWFLFPKLLAIPLLSEGIDLVIAKIRFESLPYSLSSHPGDPETAIFGR